MAEDYTFVKVMDLTDKQLSFFRKHNPNRKMIRELTGMPKGYRFGVGDTLVAAPKGAHKNELYSVEHRGRNVYYALIEKVGDEADATLCFSYSIYPTSV